MRLLILILSISVLIHSVPGNAQPIDEQHIPPPLKPWVDWVMYGQEMRHCPYVFNNHDQRYCAWPTRLTLTLNKQKGEFSQVWRVYNDSMVILPGDINTWPQKVTVNGKPVAVLQRNQSPVLLLQKGEYKISGEFIWRKMPESLGIPKDTGLLQVSINGVELLDAQISTQGQLWLRRDEVTAVQTESDSLQVQVFRKIIDGIPMQVVTRLDLNVSGAQREIVLGKALLKDALPLQLESVLPARLEPNGQLRVQARAGRWSIALTTRFIHEQTQLTLYETNPPWPVEEIWVFDARNEVRLVEIENVSGIDPRQTNLPDDWKHLPAFRLLPTHAMKFTVIRRGDPDPEPDQLTLRRTAWLDFKGKGYTFKDELSGVMTRSWRLDAIPQIDIGRASIDGNAQFITHLPGSVNKGLEVRRGALDLVAESRYQNEQNQLPVAGWSSDFQSVHTQLNLPPGWRLLAAQGSDNVPDSWLQSWSLLDLFLVLITAIAVQRLWGMKWGLLALLTLVLIWHEPNDAPRFIWLNLIASIALLRVLPQGRFRKMVTWYRNGSWVTLVIIVIPFMVQEVRTGIYPQLERPWQSFSDLMTEQVEGGAFSSQMDFEAEQLRAPMPAMSSLPEKIMSLERPKAPEPTEAKARRKLLDFDPDAMIQTGPGLPTWQWNSVEFYWNGPVTEEQQLKLMLLPPPVNMLLNFLRVLLVALLCYVVFDLRRKKSGKDNTGQAASKQAPALILLLLPLIISVCHVNDARADIPGPEMLVELRKRLLAAPDCLPDCAQIQRAQIDIKSNVLTIQLEVHASDNVVIPIPSQSKQWLPQAVLMGDKPVDALYRNESGQLWMVVPKGITRVILRGAVSQRQSFQLPLALTPHHVTFTSVDWGVDGIRDNGVADAHLKFTRHQQTEQSSAGAAFETVVFPGFVQVERTLVLDLDWRVETRVRRLSPPGHAIVLDIPLLTGESVLSERAHVEQNKIRVNLSEHQRETGWVSSLKKETRFSLVAPNSSEWVELWSVDVSPVWNVRLEGIPVVHHKGTNDRWLPQWRPWPNETVSIVVDKPKGVAGRTLTIEKSRLEVQPGKRATAMSLNIAFRASQGTQHTIVLPENAELQSVSINGQTQPIRQENRNVTIPIDPGQQDVFLQWKTPAGITEYYISSVVDLGMDSVNNSIHMQLGSDRWVLLTAGPRVGPAVLFWGVLIVIFLVSFALGKIPYTPIRWWQWFLLGIGLSQVHVVLSVIVVGWLIALGVREQAYLDLRPRIFNMVQLAIALLTLVSIAVIFYAIEQGLLGMPQMQIAGNGSSAHQLNWFSDRIDNTLPQTWVLSLPVIVYRVIMLLWALWIAFAMLRWLRWGWQCYSIGGIWKTVPKNKPVKHKNDDQGKPLLPTKNH